MARPKTTKTESETSIAESKVSAPKQIKVPMDYLIPVKSNVQGKLIYISKSGNCSEEWENFGEIAYLEFEELNRMRNTQKGFFEDNMILFEDTDDYTAEELYKALKVDKYYKNIAIFETLDEVFDLSPNDIERVVPTLSRGYRSNIASRAIQLIKDNDNRMDSVSKVKAFERALGTTFSER